MRACVPSLNNKCMGAWSQRVTLGLLALPGPLLLRQLLKLGGVKDVVWVRGRV